MATALLGALLIAGAATASPLPGSFDFVPPFLTGFGEKPILLLDVGGDGLTDVVATGGGVFQGDEVLPAGIDGVREAVHLLVQESPGVWRHRQTFLVEAPIGDLVRGDLNGDGLDDLLLARGANWVDLGLSSFLQSPDGRFLRSHDSAGSLSNAPLIGIFEDGSGRILLSWPEWMEDGPDQIAAKVLRWDRSGGIDEIWGGTLQIADDLSDYYVGARVIPADTSMILLFPQRPGPGGASSLVGVPVHRFGFGRPFAVPGLHWENNRLFSVKRSRISETWSWSASPADTLRRLIPVSGGDSLLVQTLPIDGMPPGWDADEAKGMDTGDARRLLASTSWHEGRYSLCMVGIDGDSAARVLGVWPTGGAGLRGLISIPAPPHDGQALAGTWGTYHLIPSQVPDTLPADLRFSADQGIAVDDVTGDGLVDYTFIGETENGEAILWMAEGIEQAPYFAGPQPLASLQYAHQDVYTADLDGDGLRDILLKDGDDDSVSVYTPFFYAGWRMEAGGATRLPFSHNRASTLVGDFDGDGRSEALIRVYYYQSGWIMKWGRDHAPRPPLQVDTESLDSIRLERFHTADMDADGADEIVGLSDAIGVWKLGPGGDTITRVGRWRRPHLVDALCTADLDSDGRPEVILYGQGSLSASALPPDQSVPRVLMEKEMGGSWSVQSIRAGDFDFDGKVDACLILDGPGGLFAVVSDLLGDAVVRLLALPEKLTGRTLIDSHSPIWCDIDRDGDMDGLTFCTDGVRFHRSSIVQAGEALSPRFRWTRIASANPGRGSVVVAIHPVRPGRLTLGLLDVAGRRIWSSVEDVREGSAIQLLVGGKLIESADGDELPSGAYFVRAEAGGKVSVEKIILVR